MNADPEKAEQGDDVDGIEGEHDVPELMEVHDFPLRVLKANDFRRSKELFDVRVRPMERRNVVEGFPGSERGERDAVQEGLSNQGLEGLSACHGFTPYGQGPGNRPLLVLLACDRPATSRLSVDGYCVPGVGAVVRVAQNEYPVTAP